MFLSNLQTRHVIRRINESNIELQVERLRKVGIYNFIVLATLDTVDLLLSELTNC